MCGNFSFDYFIVFVLGKCCDVWFRELLGIYVLNCTFGSNKNITISTTKVFTGAHISSCTFSTTGTAVSINNHHNHKSLIINVL